MLYGRGSIGKTVPVPALKDIVRFRDLAIAPVVLCSVPVDKTRKMSSLKLHPRLLKPTPSTAHPVCLITRHTQPFLTCNCHPVTLLQLDACDGVGDLVPIKLVVEGSPVADLGGVD